MTQASVNLEMSVESNTIRLFVQSKVVIKNAIEDILNRAGMEKNAGSLLEIYVLINMLNMLMMLMRIVK